MAPGAEGVSGMNMSRATAVEQEHTDTVMHRQTDAYRLIHTLIILSR